jgi:hypothetical protein
MAYVMGALNAMAEVRVPFKTSYWIVKTTDKMASELAIYDKTRVKLCERYAKKDAEGNVETKDGKYVFSEETEPLFNKEFSELSHQELEFPFTPIKLSEIEDDTSKITPVHVKILLLSGFAID